MDTSYHHTWPTPCRWQDRAIAPPATRRTGTGPAPPPGRASPARGKRRFPLPKSITKKGRYSLVANQLPPGGDEGKKSENAPHPDLDWSSRPARSNPSATTPITIPRPLRGVGRSCSTTGPQPRRHPWHQVAATTMTRQFTPEVVAGQRRPRGRRALPHGPAAGTETGLQTIAFVFRCVLFVKRETPYRGGCGKGF